jgi:uncharacterized hydrophobic protein (TIGR00271 family)
MTSSDQREGSRTQRKRQSLIVRVSPERRKEVLADIAQGSDPRLMYYVLLGASVVIAAFGLLANSPAVVIGAMLVSPLMTPIFGISVGLSRGDMRLLRDALVAEFGGVGLAMAIAYVLGNLPFSFDMTPEMLARTSPNLLDLFVAAFAGLAGCLAMIDERVGAALPGVAISTSLTPPLATSGLCLAFGAYSGAWGAFLLFFANFLVILAVATTTFIAAGFVYAWELGSAANMARRFASPAIGLLAVSVLLTQQLAHVAEDRRTDRAIRAVLAEQLRDDPSISVVDVNHESVGEVLEVLALVRSARVVAPNVVQGIESQLIERLGRKVALFFRCTLTKDVGATGAVSLLTRPSLDGSFKPEGESSAARVVQIAEQAIRDVLVDRPNIILEDVRSVRLPVGLVVVASIQTSQRPVPVQVERMEALIAQRLGRTDVTLLVRSIDSTDTTSKGRVLLGGAHFARLSEEDERLADILDAAARIEIEKGGELFVTNVDAQKAAVGWIVRAEVVGPRVPTPAHVKTVEAALVRKAGAPVELSLWAKTEVVVTDTQYNSVDRLIEEMVKQRLDNTHPAEPVTEEKD